MYFNKIHKETNKENIKIFIFCFINEFIKYIGIIKNNIDPLYDYNTCLALKEVEHYLLQIRTILEDRRWDDTNNPYYFKFPSFKKDINNYYSIWNENLLRPELLDKPARPNCLILASKSDLYVPQSELLKTTEGVKKSLHFIYSEIEICAAEICARNIAEYGDSMPIEFTFDMAYQCIDEVRHAMMILEYMNYYGVKLGDFTYTNNVWLQYIKGDNLAEKLAIEQIISEGNGLDSCSLTLTSLRKIEKLEKLVKLYEFLIADETIHCRHGNKWLSYIVSGNDAEYENIIDKAIAKTGLKIPGRAPIYVEARRAANYKDSFIEKRLLPKL